MKQTRSDEFIDLARRGTFVPVVEYIIADLLTPVSAFLKIAEHSDYAFLFESVEGGEPRRPLLVSRQYPFLLPRTRGGRTTIDRSGVMAETDEGFVPALRRLMAEFRSPFVPGLPRFTGGAVGFVGYHVAPIFEPALQSVPMLAVGAAFDYLAGLQFRQPPAFLMRWGLEWGWRLILEPGRLWRRYVVLNPLYAALVAFQAARVYRPASTAVPPVCVELIDA